MINAFQHVGMGVWDVDRSLAFYKKHFGFKVKLNDITMASKEMASVVGSVETMRMTMVANAKGGGVLEFIEHRSSPIRPFPEAGGYGDLGVLEIGFGVHGIDRVVEDLRGRGLRFLTPVSEIELSDGRRWRQAYLKDPDDLTLQLVEELRPGEPVPARPGIRGVIHVGLGVSDLERSKAFYGRVLGFDRQVYAFEGRDPGLDPVTGGPMPLQLAVLERSAPVSGPLAAMLRPGMVKLIHAPEGTGTHIYRGRRWGDIGCMEFCMDVSSLEEAVADAESRGARVYLPPVKIDMGSGSRGKVAYIRDPDGTVVEFVEICTVAWVSAATFMRLAMPLLRIHDRLTGG